MDVELHSRWGWAMAECHTEPPKIQVFSSGVLYINPAKVSEEIAAYLEGLNFTTKDYSEFYGDLGSLEGEVSVDLSQANSRIDREL